MNQISIVIPVYNEKENVEKLYSEIAEVCNKNNYVYEIIFVDDGSTDGTIEVISKIKNIICIRMRKNFGQTSAMDAGIKQAQYPYIITMDGDGQNDPADIPKLIEELEKTGKDMISGWRKKRKDKLLKRFFSRGAHVLRWLLIHDGIHDSGCSLKIYKKECFNGISLYGEMHRFIPALLMIKGYTIGEIVVNHRPRIAGYTKYNWKRTIKGFLDMLSIWFWNKFAVRPLHLLGGLGIISFTSGLFVSILGIVLYLENIVFLKNVLPIFAIFLLISGLQLFVFGLIADMLSKSYFGTTKDKPYLIKEVIKNNQDLIKD